MIVHTANRACQDGGRTPTSFCFDWDLARLGRECAHRLPCELPVPRDDGRLCEEGTGKRADGPAQLGDDSVS